MTMCVDREGIVRTKIVPRSRVACPGDINVGCRGSSSWCLRHWHSARGVSSSSSLFSADWFPLGCARFVGLPYIISVFGSLSPVVRCFQWRPWPVFLRFSFPPGEGGERTVVFSSRRGRSSRRTSWLAGRSDSVSAFVPSSHSRLFRLNTSQAWYFGCCRGILHFDGCPPGGEICSKPQ